MCGRMFKKNFILTALLCYKTLNNDFISVFWDRILQNNKTNESTKRTFLHFYRCFIVAWFAEKIRNLTNWFFGRTEKWNATMNGYFSYWKLIRHRISRAAIAFLNNNQMKLPYKKRNKMNKPNAFIDHWSFKNVFFRHSETSFSSLKIIFFFFVRRNKSKIQRCIKLMHQTSYFSSFESSILRFQIRG